MTGTEHEEAERLRLRRLLAIKDWGDAVDLTPEEIERIQALEPALQDRELAVRGSIFILELINHYFCPVCDASWSDAWCCACDDRCGGCRRAYAPEASEVVSVEVRRVAIDRCSVCGEPHENAL
jgi:hypothetical protein